MSFECVGKSCGRCGRSLPLSACVGSRCPHCGVVFGYQRETQVTDGNYSRDSSVGSGGSGKGSAAGVVVFLIIIGLAVGFAWWKGWFNSDSPASSTPPVAAAPTVSGGAVSDAAQDKAFTAVPARPPTAARRPSGPAPRLFPPPSRAVPPASAPSATATPPPSPPPERHYRIWTDRKGKRVEGEYVRQAKGVVTIRKPDGNDVQVPVIHLSDEDQAFLRAPARP